MSVKKIGKDFVGRLYDVIYPRRCPICDDVLYDPKSPVRPKICKDCLGKITYVSPPACLKCGKQMEDEAKEFCYDCSKGTMVYKRGVALFSYSESIKASMYGFKYRNRREYAQFYGDGLVERYGDLIRTWHADVLVPVPLHKKRLRKRGYNQAEELAKALGQRLSIPVESQLLFRVKNTRPQKELKDKERPKNLENAFQIRENVVKYKNIILIDDIYTTGTTINECARVLKNYGAVNIYYMAVCIGRGF